MHNIQDTTTITFSVIGENSKLKAIQFIRTLAKLLGPDAKIGLLAAKNLIDAMANGTATLTIHVGTPYVPYVIAAATAAGVFEATAPKEYTLADVVDAATYSEPMPVYYDREDFYAEDMRMAEERYDDIPF